MGRRGWRCVMLVLVMLIALPVDAAPRDGPGAVHLADAADGEAVISADRAAEIARRATGGRVLSVERRGGRPWFRVKVLLEGQRVRYVVIDGRSGRIRN